MIDVETPLTRMILLCRSTELALLKTNPPKAMPGCWKAAPEEKKSTKSNTSSAAKTHTNFLHPPTVAGL